MPGNKMRATFLELHVPQVKGKVFLIDVDGTLVPDSSSLLFETVVKKVKELSKESSGVYLISNNRNNGRLKELADKLGVVFIDSEHRKPSVHVLQALPGLNGKDIVVIGDQWLTDGMLARQIGAVFLHVSHLRHPGDSFLAKLRYFLDDVAAVFLRPIQGVFPYITLIRPRQWIKNLLIFTPLFFAESFFLFDPFINTCLAFAAFCAMTSGMYIINDLFDLRYDALHPVKRFRPLASGQVHQSLALVLCAALFTVTGVFIIVLPSILPAVLAYVVIVGAYNVRLKHIAVVDVLIVAACYPLRVIAGGEAAGVPISSWILLCVFFLALFLVLGKRKAEMGASYERESLKGYASVTIDYFLSMAAGLSIMSYGLYSILGSHSLYAVYSTFFVVLAVLYLLNLMYRNRGSEFPEILFLKDSFLLFSVASWGVYMLYITYFL